MTRACSLRLDLDVHEALGRRLHPDAMIVQEEVSHLLRSHLLRKASRSFRTVDSDAALAEVRQRGFRLHCHFVPGSLSGYSVTRVDRPH